MELANKKPILKKGVRFQFEPSQSSFVLLYPEGMVVLSECAAEILKLCNGNNCYFDIAKTLTEKFHGEDIESDIMSFIDDFFRQGWIVHAD